MAGRGGAGPLLGDFLAVWNGIKSTLPFLEDEAVVSVHLAPTGTRKEGYFLAAAVGFSLVRRYDISPETCPPPGLVMIEWDAASNVVQFTIRYKTCMTTSSIVDQERLFRELPVYAGPPENVIGDGWNFTAGALAGIPGGRDRDGGGAGLVAIGAAPAAKFLPKLKFAGRGILARDPFTAQPDPDPGKPAGGSFPSPNPRPVGDGRSRGSLYSLVYSALTTPQGQGYKLFRKPTPEAALIGD